MKRPTVGDTIDRRFVLRRQIARGGMGAVFEAEQRITRRTVAIKLAVEHRDRGDEIRERLLREARALTAVRHPNIVEVLDAGVCPDAGPYLAMEMLEGRPLDGILAARSQLPVEDVAHLGRQLCDALAFAHARGIIHRDLKPSNVFVARDAHGAEVIKLFDFGIAALQRAAPDLRKLTLAGAVLGTPEYMAVEQLLGRSEVDHRCDIYAAGVTLFECLTGDVPLSGTYPQIVLKALSTAAAPPVRAARPDVDPALDAAIARAIAREPEDRFADARAFRDALVAATGLAAGHTALLGGAAPAQAPDAPGAARTPTTQSLPLLAARRRETPPLLLQRRRFPRAPYVTPVRVVLPDGTAVEGRTEDISEGGVLVVTDEAFRTDAEVTAELVLPMTATATTLCARAAWTRAARGRVATGLEFVGLPDEVRRVIVRYVTLAHQPPG